MKCLDDPLGFRGLIEVLAVDARGLMEGVADAEGSLGIFVGLVASLVGFGRLALLPAGLVRLAQHQRCEGDGIGSLRHFRQHGFQSLYGRILS